MAVKKNSSKRVSLAVTRIILNSLSTSGSLLLSLLASVELEIDDGLVGLRGRRSMATLTERHFETPNNRLSEVYTASRATSSGIEVWGEEWTVYCYSWWWCAFSSVPRIATFSAHATYNSLGRGSSRCNGIIQPGLSRETISSYMNSSACDIS